MNSVSYPLLPCPPETFLLEGCVGNLKLVKISQATLSHPCTLPEPPPWLPRRVLRLPPGQPPRFCPCPIPVFSLHKEMP